MLHGLGALSVSMVLGWERKKTSFPPTPTWSYRWGTEAQELGCSMGSVGLWNSHFQGGISLLSQLWVCPMPVPAGSISPIEGHLRENTLRKGKSAGQIKEEGRKKVRNNWEHQGQRRRGRRCSRHQSSDSPQPMEDPGWSSWRLPEGNWGPQKAHTGADLSRRIKRLCGDTTLYQGKNEEEGADERSCYGLTPFPRSPPILHCSGMGWERKGSWS